MRPAIRRDNSQNSPMGGRLSAPSIAFLIVSSVVFGAGCDRPETGGEAVAPPPEEPLAVVELSPEPMQIDPATIEPIVDKSAKVTILGYHQFITSGTPGEMRIRSSKFKEQMFALKEAGIPVISLIDYMAWRRGEQPVPERCVVITIDDGYNDIYTEALPVFKELGYPFTFYVYTEFLGGGGRTLTDAQVRELIEAGGELGSHSVSHDFLVRAKRRLGEGWAQWVETELKGSKELLENRFGVEVTSFAYPYGEYNDELAALAAGYGYTSAVTVNGAKAGFESELMELPRYIIHGNNDFNWDAGTNFSGGGGISDTNNLLAGGAGETETGGEESPLRVWPEDGAVIADRMPTIWADLSKLPDVDLGSVKMKVGGFGEVPAAVDPNSRVISWTVPRRLRAEKTTVMLSLRRLGERKSDFARWSFELDRNAYYLPEYERRISAKSAASDEESAANEVRQARPVD